MEMVKTNVFTEMSLVEMQQTDGGLAITLTIGTIVSLIGGAYGLGYVIGETYSNAKSNSARSHGGGGRV